jgi:glycosyltransferase involved in cell wall biosynthesis
MICLEALPMVAGGQRVLIDLMPALTGQFDVTVIVPGDGPLANGLRACGARVIFAPMADYTLVKKGWRDLLNFAIETPRLAVGLQKIIREHQAEIVYANSSRTFIWGTLGARLAGRSIIWHVHNLLGDSKTLGLVRMLAQTKTVRKIICTSSAAADQFPQQRDKTAVVSPGVDLNHFTPSPDARAAIRAELGIRLDSPVAGIVGDLIPLKGQTVFVQAAAQVAQRVPGAVFLIVGEARPDDESRQYQRSLQTSIERQPANIQQLGFRSDIANVLNALDALVVASTTETGPLALLEALACGVPVISTPVGRAPDLLSDGTCGQLFPIGDATALADQLIGLLSHVDRRAAMSRAARERAIDELSLETYQQRVITAIGQANNLSRID